MILRIPKLPKQTGAESLPKGYKPFIIASLTILVLSLVLLAGAVVAAFVFFGGEGTPLWVVVMGGFAVFGIALGFAGFLGMMLVAGWRSFKESRRARLGAPAETEPTQL